MSKNVHESIGGQLGAILKFYDDGWSGVARIEVPACQTLGQAKSILIKKLRALLAAVEQLNTENDN